MATEITTCQICARVIKSKSGLIAHHGYQRPGQGWQTPSCMGARFRPYEVACDALPPAIASCKSYITIQTAGLSKLMTEPPATLRYQRKDAWGTPKGPEHTFERPDDFNAAQHRPSYQQESYVWQFDHLKYGFERNISGSRDSLRYLEKRLAVWKAPD